MENCLNNNLVITTEGNWLNLSLVAEFKIAENENNNNSLVRLMSEKEWIEVKISSSELFKMLSLNQNK